MLGGNCTIALGVVAALRRLGAEAPGLLYVDRHYDLNTPESSIDGGLDWMGLAHALALPGCLDVLAGAFGPRPLLQPHQVAWLGVEPQQATQWEREQADRLGLHMTTSQALAADPAGSARAALSHLPPGPLAVHLDVDVLDFTDAPLAESTGGRRPRPEWPQCRTGPRGPAGRRMTFRIGSYGSRAEVLTGAPEHLAPQFGGRHTGRLDQSEFADSGLPSMSTAWPCPAAA